VATAVVERQRKAASSRAAWSLLAVDRISCAGDADRKGPTPQPHLDEVRDAFNVVGPAARKGGALAHAMRGPAERGGHDAKT
jgi:hypothetical protein